MIPTRVIASHIQAHLEKHEDTYLLVLAEKAEVDPTTITHYVSGERAAVEFDRADRLLCAMGLVDLWRSELHDYYYGVNLKLRQCEHPNCSVWFEPTTGPDTVRGGNAQRYCTKACASSAKQGNVRRKKTNVRPVAGTHATVCRNGHKRTPENTIQLKSGKIRCRVCNNASSNRGYHRRRGDA
jgi:hypothetical protein